MPTTTVPASDATERMVQLRALMDARNSSDAWDLRCLVREKLCELARSSCLPDPVANSRAACLGLQSMVKTLSTYCPCSASTEGSRQNLPFSVDKKVIREPPYFQMTISGRSCLSCFIQVSESFLPETVMMRVPRSSDTAWRDCYTAALFQDDITKVPALIARAESEIVARKRLLFEAPGDNAHEMRALHNALRMLQMLKSCVNVKCLLKKSLS